MVVAPPLTWIGKVYQQWELKERISVPRGSMTENMASVFLTPLVPTGHMTPRLQLTKTEIKASLLKYFDASSIKMPQYS